MPEQERVRERLSRTRRSNRGIYFGQSEEKERKDNVEDTQSEILNELIEYIENPCDS